jgi:hypothetical protein
LEAQADGLVLLFVRKSGRAAKQLFSDGFHNTGSICDINLLNPILEHIGLKSSVKSSLNAMVHILSMKGDMKE